MSDLLARVVAAFVDPPSSELKATTGLAARSTAAPQRIAPLATTAARSAHVAWAAAARGPMRAATPVRSPAPTVVVLCAPGRGRAAAAASAMALTRVLGVPCAIATAMGMSAAPRSIGVRALAAGRVAATLRARGRGAVASGRLVWLADRRAEMVAGIVASDPAGAAAAASAELAHAVAASGAPGVVAIPLARTDALDRVIAWHDGIVVVREPDATAAVAERIEASLAALGRPVVCVAPASRQAAACAELGLRAPAAFVPAMQRLGLA